MVVTFREVFDALMPSYRTVEVRAILVAPGEEEGWWCTATVIRLSNDPQVVLEHRHKTLVGAQGFPPEILATQLGLQHHPEAFRGMNIELSAYPISEFWDRFVRIGNGLISCRTRDFHVWAPEAGFDLENTQVTRRFDSYATDDGRWDVFYLGEGERTGHFIGTPDRGGNTIRVEQSDLDGWAREVGQSSYRARYERVLGVPFGQGRVLEIKAPVYARIDEIRSLNGAVRVEGSLNSNIGGLSVECNFYRTAEGGSRYLLSSSPASVDLKSDVSEPDVTTFTEEFEVDSSPDMGIVEATIFKRTPMRIDLFVKSSRLRSGVAVYKALTSFVPEQDVTEILSCLVAGLSVSDCRLYARFKAKDGSKKMDELLEYLTNYLLALCHLNPILLSNPQYDTLLGNLNAGSADIVATDSDSNPILVSCTMAMPDSRKVGLLLATRTAICRRMQTPESRVKMLLVTGKPSVSEEFSEMRIVGAEDLVQAWEALQLGNEAAARAIFVADSQIH